jgi:hypothetical protein
MSHAAPNAKSEWFLLLPGTVARATVVTPGRVLLNAGMAFAVPDPELLEENLESLRDIDLQEERPARSIRS